MAQILDGKAVATAISASMQDMMAERQALGRQKPRLAIVLVGDDAGSESYAQSKVNLSRRFGVACEVRKFPPSITEAHLCAEIKALGSDPLIHGILVELPLPKALNTLEVFRLIPVDKDIEGMSLESVARLALGTPLFIPATPAAVIRILDAHDIELQGREVVVVGRSRVVGRPLTSLLTMRNATVTVCHSFTEDLAAHTRRADILVVAIGRPGFIGADHVKPGAVVVDVGTNYTESGLRGDVDFNAVAPQAGWITPVPGGVGPVTTALIISNVLRAAELQENRSGPFFEDPLMLRDAP